MNTVVLSLRRDRAASVDDEAAALARRLGGRVVAVGVVRPNASLSSRDQASWDARFEHAVAAGRRAHVPVRAELVEAEDPVQALADVADRHHASVILVQRHARNGIDRMRSHRLGRRLRKLSHAVVHTVSGH